MYRFLIRNLFLSHGTRFGQATLNYINSFPNLEKVGFGSVALLQSEDILDDPNFDYLARSHMRRNRQLVKTIRAVLATFGELEDRSVWVWIKQDFVLSASLPDHRDERDMVDQMHWETDSRPRLTPRLAPHLPDKVCRSVVSMTLPLMIESAVRHAILEASLIRRLLSRRIRFWRCR